VQAAQVSSYTDVIVCGTDYVQFMGNLFGKLPVCLPDYGSCASKLYYQSEYVSTTPIMGDDNVSGLFENRNDRRKSCSE
jgi:hypothetical protein